MRRLSMVLFCLLSFLLCFAILFTACDESAGPADPGGGDDDDDVIVDPIPDGVLLEGEAGSSAKTALYTLLPTAVPEEGILEDGLLTTRLAAVVHPDATVGEVNAALEAAGARIVSMMNDRIHVTLKIDAVDSAEDARAIAQALRESPGILYAYPARQALPLPLPEMPPPGGLWQRDLPGSGADSLNHLIAMRMPPAWNAAQLAVAKDHQVTVLVPDDYRNHFEHHVIDCQVVDYIGGGTSADVIDGMDTGNHGYHVSGIIGADFDGMTPTGTSPDPVRLLDLRSWPIGGLSERDLYQAMFLNTPWGDPVVVNTSIGYTKDNIDHSKVDIVQDALSWLDIFAHSSEYILHVTAAGNDGTDPGDAGDAHWTFAPAIAHFFADPRELIYGTGIDETDSLMLEMIWQELIEETPEAAPAVPNVIVVGSSGLDGSKSGFSNRNSELRTVGERVLGPCWSNDPGYPEDPDLCHNYLASYSGTSMATPQVAGLAAYLWNLKPEATVAEIREILVQAYEQSYREGLVDAYLAVLCLDRWEDMAVRRAIFDVAGNSSSPGSNGRFDEHDIDLFLDAFAAEQGLEQNWSRYDINGDGFTGGAHTIQFALGTGFPPVFVTNRGLHIADEWMLFDETAVDDRTALLFYSYSPLYEGDPDERWRVLEECGFFDWEEMTGCRLHITVNLTFEDSQGGEHHYEPYFLELRGTGGVFGRNLDFALEEIVLDGWTYPSTGTLTGVLSQNLKTLVALQVNASGLPGPGGERQDHSIQLFLEEVASRWFNENRIEYFAAGTEACEKLEILQHGWGDWVMTDYGCVGGSSVRFVINDY